jgi:lysophospholipase L1-like esterase
MTAALNFTSDVNNSTPVTRIRLFALGDSLTVGAQSTDGKGYRSILRAAITATPLATGPLDFVGPVPDDPIDHFAANGRPIVYYTTGTNLTDQIGSGIRRAHPDVVVWMAGTNDCINNGTTYNGTTTPAAWASVLETLRTTEPQAKIITLEVPSFPTGSSYASFQSNVDDLNSKLPALVAVQQGLGQTVALLDTMSGVVDADYSIDGLHFNDAGYAKLEAKIEAQLRIFYP